MAAVRANSATQSGRLKMDMYCFVIVFNYSKNSVIFRIGIFRKNNNNKAFVQDIGMVFLICI